MFEILFLLSVSGVIASLSWIIRQRREQKAIKRKWEAFQRKYPPKDKKTV